MFKSLFVHFIDNLGGSLLPLFPRNLSPQTYYICGHNITINAIIIAINIGIINGKSELASLASGACIYLYFVFKRPKHRPVGVTFLLKACQTHPFFFFFFLNSWSQWQIETPLHAISCNSWKFESRTHLAQRHCINNAPVWTSSQVRRHHPLSS